MHAIAKIIARHANREHVEVGEIVNVVPDFVMLNDRGAARAADLLRQMGGEKVFDPSRIIVVFDHHYPPNSPAGTRCRRKRPENGSRNKRSPNFTPVRESGTSFFRKRATPFRVRSSSALDSHTVTNSALGCVATGMGHSDIASCLAIGHNWLRVPEILRIQPARPASAERVRQGHRAAHRAALWRGCGALSRCGICRPAGRGNADG